MSPSCPMTGGGFRGPPVPLLLAPVVIQFVRMGSDPKMMTYLKEISKDGPMAIAENAHKFAQYALSKVPTNVLYWFTSRVLNLPPDTAMHTTEFLKSRSDLEILVGNNISIDQYEKGHRTSSIPSVIETRLEKLELEYQALQETHNKSLQSLTNKGTDMSPKIYVRPRTQRPYAASVRHIANFKHQRNPPLPDVPLVQQIEASEGVESMQLMQLDSSPPISQMADAEAQKVLQDVGLRLGRIFLEWAGDTLKQNLVVAASKSSANSTIVGAGVDLASRLVDAIVT